MAKGLEVDMLPYTIEQWKWIARKRMEGYSMNELAEFLGVHRNTVERKLNEVTAFEPEKFKRPPLSTCIDEFNRLGKSYLLDMER